MANKKWSKAQHAKFKATMAEKAKGRKPPKKVNGSQHFPLAIIPDRLPPALAVRGVRKQATLVKPDRILLAAATIQLLNRILFEEVGK